MKKILFVLSFLALALSTQAQEDSLRFKKNDGSYMAFPRSAVDSYTETSDAYKVRIAHTLSDVNKVTFNRGESPGGIHPETPYDYEEGEMPCVSVGQVMANIDANQEALPGGSIIIGIVTRELIECFYISISDQPGYYIKYPDEPTLSGEDYVYRLTILFPQDWNHDVVITVGGHTKDGRSFVCKEMPVRYHEAGTGALQVSLSFNNAKDIDLHLYTPSNQHFYWYNKGGTTTINGQTVRYGLDVDSNPNCNIDNINCENITFPEELLENGTYEVRVNMYKNCDPSIPTAWTCVTRRGGQLVTNQITEYGNPASGVYPVGQPSSDNTLVMRFNVERVASAPGLAPKLIIKPLPLDASAIEKMKMEEEQMNQEMNKE